MINHNLAYFMQRNFLENNGLPWLLAYTYIPQKSHWIMLSFYQLANTNCLIQ